MVNIDMEKYRELTERAGGIVCVMLDYQNNLNEIEQEIKKMLPKGYWYTYDIDTSWKRPKKYSIQNVKCTQSGILLHLKESGIRKPWVGYNDRPSCSVDTFLNMNIYKTEQEAIEAHKKRICPKCGGFMMLSETPWCLGCMTERDRVVNEFHETHMFYCPADNTRYGVEYDDELTWNRGYNGRLFIIRRKDTGEVIRTNNLWSHGCGQLQSPLPEIEFLKED